MQTLRSGLTHLTALWLAGCLDDHGHWQDPDAEAGHPAQLTFYLRLDGDDANSGRSPEDAWRSLQRVNRAQLAPGSEILLEGGATFSGTLRLEAADGGDADLPVKVSSLGMGHARIDAGNASAIVIDNASGVLIEQLDLVGAWNADAQSGNEGEGVSVVGTASGQRRRGVTLRELDISGFKLAGIGLHARPSGESKNSGYRTVEIDDCSVHDNGDFGILSDGPYSDTAAGYSHAEVNVRRSRVYNNRGLKQKGEHTGSGIVLSDVEDALIERCVAHHNGEFNDHEGGGGYGIWAWDATRVRIEHNESYENKTSTSDGGGFDLDGGVTDSVIRYNYSHGNRGAGYGAFQFAYARGYANNRIQYNISQDDGFAFLIWDGNGDMGSIAFVHNVGYGAKPMLVTYSALAQASFANNIFFGTGPALFDVYDGANFRLEGNAYWTQDAALNIAWNSGTSAAVKFSDFEQYRSMTGAESQAGMHADPQLVAAGTGPTLDDAEKLSSLHMYELEDSSPLIDHGVDLTQLGLEVPTHDFFGAEAPRGSAPDIGVHEPR